MVPRAGLVPRREDADINESWWPWYDPSIFMIRFRPVRARMIRTASSVDSVPEFPNRQYGSR